MRVEWRMRIDADLRSQLKHRRTYARSILFLGNLPSSVGCVHVEVSEVRSGRGSVEDSRSRAGESQPARRNPEACTQRVTCFANINFV